MSLDNIFAQINQHLTGEEKSVPPVEQWDPEYCGELDLHIKANGEWWYQGTPIKRLRLVKLFASVLKKVDDEYFLVTPVEKIKITVEDAPFLITRWEWQDDIAHSTMLLATNLGDEFALSSKHPMRVDEQGSVYVTVRRNLEAKVHRNAYYQLIEESRQATQGGEVTLQLESDGEQFTIGRYAE